MINPIGNTLTSGGPIRLEPSYSESSTIYEDKGHGRSSEASETTDEMNVDSETSDEEEGIGPYFGVFEEIFAELEAIMINILSNKFFLTI